MALSLANVGGFLKWTFSRVVAGAGTVKVSGASSFPITYATTVNKGQLGVISALAAAGTSTLDLTSLGTDPSGEAVGTLAKGCAIWFYSSASEVELDVTLTNGLNTWFLKGASARLVIPAGGFAAIGYPEAKAVTVDSTHKVIRFTNTGAVATDISYGIFGK